MSHDFHAREQIFFLYHAGYNYAATMMDARFLGSTDLYVFFPLIHLALHHRILSRTMYPEHRY